MYIPVFEKKFLWQWLRNLSTNSRGQRKQKSSRETGLSLGININETGLNTTDILKTKINPMIEKFIRFLAKNKKIILLFIIFFSFIGGGDNYVFAEDPTPGATAPAEGQPTVEDGMQTMINILNIVYIGAAMIIGILTQVISMFLHPGWVNGDAIGLDTKLKDLWIMVSNVVYFLFALLLVWIAFMNIVGQEGENYQLKQALPKFIIGVLIVPFSWFFIQIMLSFSAVLTASVLTLPFDTFKNTPTLDTTVMNTKVIPKSCKIDLGTPLFDGGTPTTIEGANATIEKMRGAYECKEEKMSISDLIGEDSPDVFSIIAVYTYAIMGVKEYENLKSGDVASTVKTVGDLGLQFLFNVIFMVVYFILLIAIALALFVRGVYLWLYVIFAPAFGLLFFFKGKEGGGEGLAKKFNIKEFISLCLVPVYVAAALSFGLLFILTVRYGLTEVKDTGNKGVSITNSGATMNVGNFDLTINGTIFGSHNDEVQQIMGGIKGGVGTIIINLIALAVLWLAVMAALKSSTITGEITQPIQDFGGSIGSLIAKSPTYMPLFPGGLSAGGLAQVGRETSSHFEQKSVQTGSSFVKNYTPFGDSVAGSSSTREAAAIINQDGPITGRDIKAFRKAMEDWGDTAKMTNDSGFRDLTVRLATKAGLQQSDIDNYKDKLNNPEQMAQFIALIDRHMEDVNTSVREQLLTKESKGTGSDYKGYKSADLNKDIKRGTDTTDSDSTSTNGRGGLNVKEEDNDGSTKKIRIDNNTLIRVKSDGTGFKDDSSYKDFAQHLVKDVGGGKITEEQLKKSLEDMGVTDTTKQVDILKEIEKYIRIDPTTGAITFDGAKANEGGLTSGSKYYAPATPPATNP